MPVRVRLGQNWYRYADLEILDRDIAAQEMRAAQLEKQLTMTLRNLDGLRAGREVLAAQVAEGHRKTRAKEAAARADKRRTEAEDGDDGL